MRIHTLTSERIKLMALWCSVLVCFNHAYTLDHRFTAIPFSTAAFVDHSLQNLVKHGLARISTPFFFLTAAFMLFNALSANPEWRWGSYLAEVRKRVRTLAVPFLCWAVLSFALLAALQAIHFFRPYISRNLMESSPIEFVEYLLWQPVAYQLWFVRHLFLLVLAAPIIYLAVRNRTVGMVWLGLWVVAWFGWHEHFTTRAVLFFSLGAFLAIHRPRILIFPRFRGLPDKQHQWLLRGNRA